MGDQVALLLQLPEAALEELAELLGRIKESVLLDHFNRGNARPGGDGVAAEGGGMHAGAEAGGDLRSREHRPARQTAAESLGEGHHIGGHAVMLVAEPFSRPAATSLDFVEDEEEIIVVRQFAEALQKAGRRELDATFSLNGLDHNRTGVAVNQFRSRCQVAMRGIAETGDERTKSLVIFWLGGGCQRAERPSVKPAGERDNFVLSLAVQTGQFD